MRAALPHRDLVKIPELLRQLYSATNLESLVQTAFAVTSDLIDSESQNYNEIDDGKRNALRPSPWELRPIQNKLYEVEATQPHLKCFVVAHPMRFDLDAASVCAGFEKNILDHPIIQHSRKHRVLDTYRLSDLIGDRQFMDSRLYNEFYCHFPVRKLLITYLDYGPGSEVVLALARGPGRDFSDRDLKLMQVLGPHFRQAWLNVRALARQKKQADTLLSLLARHRANHLLLAPLGTIEWMTPGAAQCLTKFFGSRRDPNRLPEPLESWLKNHPVAADPATIRDPESARAFVGWSDSAKLTCTVEPWGDGGSLLTLREEQIRLTSDGFRYPGLTTRENEVLFWMAQGRSNADIATLVGASPRTINKHVQNIFQKMGVISRAEAMVAAAKKCSDLE